MMQHMKKQDEKKSDSENENSNNNNIPSHYNNSISNAELQYMLEGCSDDFRIDGRSCADIRPYSIHGTNNHSSCFSSPSAFVLSNGSARVSLPGGCTDVLCSTKAEIGRPTLLRPNDGIVEVNVDYFSSTLDSNNKRQRRMDETELSSILSRLVLPNALSTESLCISPGKYCWKISIDILVLAEDGCVVDVASMAIYKALNDTVLPVVKSIPKQNESDGVQLEGAAGGIAGAIKSSAKDDFMIESGEIADAITPDGAKNCPIILTVCILQQQSPFHRDGRRRKYIAPAVMVIDARSEEELCAMTKVSVAVDQKGMICGVLKFGAGHGAMPYRMLADISDLAVIASKSVFQHILCPHVSHDGDERNERMDFVNTTTGQASDFLHGHFQFQ